MHILHRCSSAHGRPATICSRLKSTRLPGLVAAPVCKPLHDLLPRELAPWTRLLAPSQKGNLKRAA